MDSIEAARLRRTVRPRRGPLRPGDEITAVAGIDLAVRTGTIVGLPGPNGAGSPTTTMLATLLLPSGGRALPGRGRRAVRPERDHLRARLARDLHPPDRAPDGTLVSRFLTPRSRLSWRLGYALAGIVETGSAAAATLLRGRCSRSAASPLPCRCSAPRSGR
ncbi:MAG: hypothetical protein QJR03_12425 [Sphaerobacter sp.]|nr:hypothetical protein [Sphaerobacter sp.]